MLSSVHCLPSSSWSNAMEHQGCHRGTPSPGDWSTKVRVQFLSKAQNLEDKPQVSQRCFCLGKWGGNICHSRTAGIIKVKAVTWDASGQVRVIWTPAVKSPFSGNRHYEVGGDFIYQNTELGQCPVGLSIVPLTTIQCHLFRIFLLNDSYFQANQLWQNVKTWGTGGTEEMAQ